MATESVPPKATSDAASDSSSDLTPERPTFELATQITVTGVKQYTDSYAFELKIQYQEEEGNIVLQGILKLVPKVPFPEVTVNVSSLTFYGEEVGEFGASTAEPPFLIEQKIKLQEVNGIVRFFIDQTDSLVFGIDVKKNNGKRLRTMKRVASIS